MQNQSTRTYVVGGIFICIALIFIARLFTLQVVTNNYNEKAMKNALRKVTNYPGRGLIYDRNGKPLVENKAVYDLLATPREIGSFDTLQLCNILSIEKSFLIEELKKAKKYSLYRPSIVVKQFSPQVNARLQEKLFKYPGFYVQSRTIRQYPKPIAAHLLGYIGEINQNQINSDTEKYYGMGDYIGITGIERAYEKELRGKKGSNYFLVDVHNRVKGSYNEGKNDTLASLGNSLTMTIDRDLQEYAEMLMKNKKGAVVAIEPSTGEILAFYSGPSYNPNKLVGRERGNNYSELLKDTLHSLTNRAISAAYSPGSTFKMLNGLIAIQEGEVTPHTPFTCSGPGSTPMKCTHFHSSSVQFHEAIVESCNPYFFQAFRAAMGHKSTIEESYRVWYKYAQEFGLGKTLGTEFFGQTKGNLPTADYYNRIYGKGSWNAYTIRSLAIGQGEIILTPLQLANYATILANRGYYIEPHVVKQLVNSDHEATALSFEKHQTSIDTLYFGMVARSMNKMVDHMGGRYKTKINDIDLCGKTGTIQNSSGGSDHSSFIGFAPLNNPKIAIAVFVENGVWGSRYAAPIGSLIMEKFIRGEILEEQRRIDEEKISNINLLGKHNDAL
ncbi:MAG: penicillin-binding protein 2 [Mangrovibacterium sp.]